MRGGKLLGQKKGKKRLRNWIYVNLEQFSEVRLLDLVLKSRSLFPTRLFVLAKRPHAPTRQPIPEKSAVALVRSWFAELTTEVTSIEGSC